MIYLLREENGTRFITPATRRGLVPSETVLAEVPEAFAKEHPADLDISTITTENGFEQTVVTVNEERKAQRIANEASKREAQEQKQTERRTKERAEIAKLKSAKPTTLPELTEIVMAMAKVVLADKGEIDLAEDEAAPKGSTKEARQEESQGFLAKGFSAMKESYLRG